ncbi:MAG: hypothetical protein SPI44_02315 [Bacilli bacterium]|nr:hypothetical protein [Mollicutes bacterium]MDY6071695.1 hypothetical protein [Bacilli bacterium]
MEEEASSKNYFLIIMIFLFIIFLILYISGEAGYYEYKVHTKTILTEEAIKEFEKDISEGKNVKLENYIKTEKIDYSNMISDTGYNVGILIEKFMNKGIKKTVKILSSLFLD